MSIDISQIKPGDTVTLVPLEVHSVDAGWVALFTDLEGIVQFDWHQIAAHHPAPREIGVGDRVTRTEHWQKGTVEHVARKFAWVLWDGGYETLAFLEDLTHWMPLPDPPKEVR